MKTKSIFAIIGIAAVLGMVGMTFSYAQTALADKGGDPDNSATSGKACDNAADRNERFHERLGDDNTNNDGGQNQAHDSSAHNNKGLEFNNCFT